MTIIKWFTYSIKSPVVRSCTRRYYEYLWTPSGLLLFVPMVTRTRSVVIAAGSVSQLVHTWDLSSFFFFLSPPSLSLNHGRSSDVSIALRTFTMEIIPLAADAISPVDWWSSRRRWLNWTNQYWRVRGELRFRSKNQSAIHLFLSKVFYTCASQLKWLARFTMLTITSYTNIILIYLTSLLSILKGYKIRTIDYKL